MRETDLPERKILPTPPVKNQGPIGTCSIFTAAGLYETHNPAKKVSESEFAVYAETQIDDCEAGINLGYTLALAQKDGFLLEKDAFSYEDVYVPYVARINNINTHDFNWKEKLIRMEKQTICLWNQDKRKSYNATMENIGSPLKISGQSGCTPHRLGNPHYLHLVSHSALDSALNEGKTRREKGAVGIPACTDLHQIRLALAHGLPVAVAADVYDNCWSPEKHHNYMIKLPSSQDERQGSHAFMITGYNNDYFLIRNSWGSSWGNNGYAWMPGDYLKKYASEVITVEK